MSNVKQTSNTDLMNMPKEPPSTARVETNRAAATFSGGTSTAANVASKPFSDSITKLPAPWEARRIRNYSARHLQRCSIKQTLLCVAQARILTINQIIFSLSSARLRTPSILPPA